MHFRSFTFQLSLSTTQEEVQALEQGQKAFKEAQEVFDKKLDRLISLLGLPSKG